jgi:hypothetical protein
MPASVALLFRNMHVYVTSCFDMAGQGSLLNSTRQFDKCATIACCKDLHIHIAIGPAGHDSSSGVSSGAALAWHWDELGMHTSHQLLSQYHTLDLVSAAS